MSDTPYDPFNCPKCGSHDYGLLAPQIGCCPHCLKSELTTARAEVERLQGYKQHCDALFALAQKYGLSDVSSESPATYIDAKLHRAEQTERDAERRLTVLKDVLEWFRKIDPQTVAEAEAAIAVKEGK